MRKDDCGLRGYRGSLRDRKRVRALDHPTPIDKELIMQDNLDPPPTPVPPASQPPYPPHPAPHVEAPTIPVARQADHGNGLGVLGMTLIGGAVAGAIGLLIAAPFLRRTASKKVKRTPTRRKKA
jgi:hypothetical protein